MNTKFAIRILLEYISHKGNKWEVSMTTEDIKEFEKIIALLQRGKKYEQIVNDIESDFENLHCNIMSENCFNIIKQKYFPRLEETINWKDKFYELEEEYEESERKLKSEIECWKFRYYNKGGKRK